MTLDRSQREAARSDSESAMLEAWRMGELSTPLARVLALCGHPVARELTQNTGWLKGRTRPSWGVVEEAPPTLWLKIFAELAACLPPRG